jgi:hypothetical protein
MTKRSKKTSLDGLFKNLTGLVKQAAKTKWGFFIVMLICCGLVLFIDWRYSLGLFFVGIIVWFFWFK